ncbi:MAG: hypothetical protein IKZ95_09545, partial [Lachnospiraceae bacterium]|nr:hypothetical protein [Lachnospiraceae bacterium]
TSLSVLTIKADTFPASSGSILLIIIASHPHKSRFVDRKQNQKIFCKPLLASSLNFNISFGFLAYNFRLLPLTYVLRGFQTIIYLWWHGSVGSPLWSLQQIAR